MLHVFLFCDDSDQAKVDLYSLSQQSLMEFFVEDVSPKNSICTSGSRMTDISRWRGVTLNIHQEIIEIYWALLSLKGTIGLRFLPQTLRKLIIECNFLNGSLDLTSLPSSLTQADLFSNKFSGSVDLKRLPESLEILDLAENSLNGTIDLEHLPASLKTLQLNDNSFSGQVSFHKLPNGLCSLFLHKNSIEGEIDFDLLPKTLKKLNIQHTLVSGERVVEANCFPDDDDPVFDVDESKVKISLKW